MLKNIEVKEDQSINRELARFPSSITVASPVALVEEAEKRTHKRGPKPYLERLLMGKTKLKKNPGWYPDEKRIEVAALFASGVTNATDLERLTNVKSTVIRDWRTSDWWPELLERIHTAHDEETVGKFTEIVDKSLEVVQDRLINGDYVYNAKHDKIIRKPVSLRDATVAGAIIVDKRQLLRGKATSRSESVSVDARLSKLAEEFTRFVKAKDVTPLNPESSTGSVSQTADDSITEPVA